MQTHKDNLRNGVVSCGKWGPILFLSKFQCISHLHQYLCYKAELFIWHTLHLKKSDLFPFFLMSQLSALTWYNAFQPYFFLNTRDVISFFNTSTMCLQLLNPLHVRFLVICLYLRHSYQYDGKSEMKQMFMF